MCSPKHTYTKLILILFLTARNWKIHKGPLIFEWLNKLGVYWQQWNIINVKENRQSTAVYDNMDEVHGSKSTN